MDAYKALAASYDRLTEDVDYGAVVDFYRLLWEREGISPRTAVDLACGTGSVTVLLAEMGLQITGVDMSPEMLSMASGKLADRENAPLFYGC